MASFASLIGSQDYSGAVKLLDAQISETRHNYEEALHKLVQLHLNRGICNERLQLNRMALKDFDAALALAPSNVKALLHKGQVLTKLGKATEARVVWETAASLADPASDLDVIMHINEALAGLGSSSTAAAVTPALAPVAEHVVPASRPASTASRPASTASRPASSTAAAVTPALAPVAEHVVPASRPASTASRPASSTAAAVTPALAPVAEHVVPEAEVTAAPQPQKTAEAGIAAPHANGIIAAGQTNLSASTGTGSSAQKAAASSPSSPAAAAAAKGGEAKAAPKAFKGFLSRSTGGSSAKQSAGSATTAAASTRSGNSSSSSANKPSSSSSEDVNNVVDIDCAAEQQKQQRATPVSFGEQIAQQQQHSVMLTLAINQINSGQVEAAEELLNKILARNPRDLSALVARGTARALRRELKGAEDDFTAAIQIEPRYPDTYKRRGQARSAMGNMKGALEDLDKAAKILEAADKDGMGALMRAQGGEDPRSTAADCYSERGMLLQKMKDYRKAVKELTKAAEQDLNNPQVWNFLGLARVSMGDIRKGCEAYHKALSLDPDMKEAWLNLGQACKEEARVKEAEEALLKSLKNADGTPCLPAYRLLATMRQGAGRQADAVKLLDKALSFKKDSVELLYLRAICYHALGYMRKAVADYESCMHAPLRYEDGPLAEEARMYQFLCYYQKDIALWMAHNFDTKAADICLDTELAPAFKEGWCKKCFPDNKIFSTHKVQPDLPPEDSPNSSSSSSSKRCSSSATSPRTSNNGPSSSSTSPSGPSSRGADSPTPCLETAANAAAVEQLAALTDAADKLGVLLQNHHQGFLPNVRQQRAAGYAAVELAQTVRALLAERAAGREGLWVNSEGSSGEGGCSGRHLFGWRDAMDIVVKWRQLSEPADQVVWVDLLTKEEFENGFGSHTPMYSGQTKCVRYYMNFHRALDLAKECLLELGHAYDALNSEVPLGGADKQEAVQGAKTALELYRIIGQDSWVVVPLHSIHKHQHLAANGTSDTGTGTSDTGTSDTGTSTSDAANGKAKGSSNSKGSSSSKGSGRPGSSGSSRRQGVQPVVVPEGCLEGTRLTLVNVPNQPDAVEFSIRTPVTPPRWKEFDAELEAAWERIIAALLSGDKHSIATAIMCYAYYWYNFMPLARGTAAVGYTTMLGLFWAAGMPISTPIPKDYQVDWEAILAKHPQQFISRLSEWFVPKVALPCAPVPDGSSSNAATMTATAAAAPVANGDSSSSNGSSDAECVLLPEIESFKPVAEVLATFRQRLNALNGPEATPV